MWTQIGFRVEARSENGVVDIVVVWYQTGRRRELWIAGEGARIKPSSSLPRLWREGAIKKRRKKQLMEQPSQRAKLTK